MAARNATKSAEIQTDERIPENLRGQALLTPMLAQYLGAVDEISGYNTEVLKEKDSEWTQAKLISQARDWARPVQGDPDADSLAAVKAYEDAQNALNAARQQLVKFTAGKLGVNLDSVSERDSSREEPLKEKRKEAVEIGKQFASFASLSADKDAANALRDFLSAFPVPTVGREGSFDATETSQGAPKHRVEITVKGSDGETLLTERGLTKAALALPKLYARGQAPKAKELRDAWEAPGNTTENVVQPVVEWQHGKYTYLIRKY